jgi:hypothetical protein
MLTRAIGVILLVLAGWGFAAGQTSGGALTNADVVKMVKSGIDAQTIVLVIRREPTRFDMSVQGLISLKKAGVSQSVMDAMLAATTPAAGSTDAKEMTGPALLEKALAAFGDRDQLLKLRALRWEGNVAETVRDDASQRSFQEEHTVVYPDRLYVSVRGGDGPLSKLVITPHFSYLSSGGLTRAMGPVSTAIYNQQIQFDPAYIAQNPDSFTVSVQGIAADADTFKIGLGGTAYVWRIDAKTGRLLSIEHRMKSGETVTREYSDYRKVGGLILPFQWSTKTSGRAIVTTVNGYAVNPNIDESLFLRPDSIDKADAAVNFRVLDSKSVPHAQELGGNYSTSCQLSQDLNTTVANPLDDINFGAGTTPSNLQMSCNSWDTTRFWSYKLNAMLVMTSEGNASIISCDQGPRSKCVPLQAGLVIDGVRTPDGIEVTRTNSKGKPQAVDYSIVQTVALP